MRAALGLALILGGGILAYLVVTDGFHKLRLEAAAQQTASGVGEGIVTGTTTTGGANGGKQQ